MTTSVDNEEVDEKPRTLFVGNIPPTASKRELEMLFGDIGPLKRCYMQYPRKGEGMKQQEPLVAYVTYALTEDATAAIEKFSGHKIGKNKLNIKLIKSRSDQYREPKSLAKGGVPKGISSSSSNLEPLPEKPKTPRPKPVNKKSRLIVRNLSFNATQESIKKHFSTCGDVKEINILKKPNGKLVGCAFIQYDNVFEAAKAIKTLNLQPFLNRPIAIDWAVPKEKFQSNSGEAENVKAEDEIKTESQDDNNEDDDDEIEEEDNKKKYKKPQKKETKKSKKHDDDDSDADYEDEDDDDASDSEEETKFKPEKKISNDAEEGKTLFIRNLNFDTTQEELKEFFEKFGPLYYALVCKDPLTEHPKGTAFVKFKELDGAKSCLDKYEEDQSEFTLGRRNFYVSVALAKGKLETKLNAGKEKEVKKDNRHLYLTREGFIRPGSEAANGVSIQDMNLRSTLHQKKKQMLKDLSVFVSDKRLCIHNLPPTLKDGNLKKIFLKHAGPGARITEAKIMRDLQSLNIDSKGYAFVTFTEHEHALQALRTINNNPKIFTLNKRPIVEFSLENRKAIQAKERREEKSREKNPITKGSKQNNKEEGQGEEEVKLSKKQKRKLQRQMKKNSNETDETLKMEVDEDDNDNDNEDQEENEPPKKKKMRHRDVEETLSEFSGLTAKEGITSLPSYKAKGKITRKSLKPKKKMKPQERRMREPKTRPKGRESDKTDNVDKMVSKHEKQLKKAIKGDKTKKWFE